MGLFFLPTGGALSVVVTGDGAHCVRLEDYFESPGLPSTYFFNEQKSHRNAAEIPSRIFTVETSV